MDRQTNAVAPATGRAAGEDWPGAFRRKLGGTTIPALDALRAVSVFLVIVYHFGFESVNGGLGVEVFFVLSGFLITWLLIREHDRTGDISFSGFYKRRALRIF